MQKSLFKFPKGVIAVAGAAVMMVCTLSVMLLSNTTAEAQSSGVWSGSYFCQVPGRFICLPTVDVQE